MAQNLDFLFLPPTPPYFYGTLYLRDSNDVIWKNETDKNGFPLEMVGWFNKELGIIDDQMIIQVIDE